MSPEERAYLGLGSNVGDRLANLQAAVTRLAARDGVTVRASSRVYATDPVPPTPPQPEYLNAVVALETTLEPYELLDACREIENALGRERLERWGPRSIDLDILTFGDRMVDEPDLQIPHPRMHERGFVLIPLLELDANPPLPGGRTVASLRLGAGVLGGVRLFAPPLATA
ncbi:MAG: 2-amino-4-hydroxy-6-hydroxymethyldihydropteridine diphosphokinase [Actinomycetota bacterium]